MADLAPVRAAAMSAPGRRETCLEQARIFREMAAADPANCNYWRGEARKWLERAATPVGHVVVTVEVTPVLPEVTASGRGVISVPAQPR
jgi:hypothetical protein